jgi:GST-like protein
MTDYTPPRIWTWNSANGGQFASINRPIAGPTHDKALPVGRHPLQLYSLGTPNGVKVTIMLEELLAAGRGAEYDAWLINIGTGDQFGSGFVAVNPNSKIPAMVDHGGPTPPHLRSGSILLYLAEKFGAFLPEDRRTHRMPQLAVLAGRQRPYLGGGFGISMPTHRTRSNMRSTVSQWRPNASSTLDRRLAESPISRATATPSPTWRSSRGMADWPKAGSMAAPSS